MVHNKVLGYSTHDFTPEQLLDMGRTDNESQVALDVLTNNTLAFAKLSALFFYRRIFCDGSKGNKFGWLTGITIGVVILWLLVFQFLAGFQCGTHFSALWDGNYLKYCTISFPFLYGLVISDFLLDIWILLLPIPSIIRLHTSVNRKLSIIAVFLVALVGLGGSTARMVQYIKVELGGPDYLLNTDHERLITQSFFYTMLESGVALIAVNLPSLRVFHISVKTGELVRSVRSLLDLSFLRSNSSNAGRNASKPPGSSDTHEGAPSFNTRPSRGSSYVVHHQDIPMALQDFPDELQRPHRTVSREPV
ncbi:hypothetical protein GGS20DRAFT_552832 [Poronia punctata]|nr:hypothetical protein GGS20DRAFT_552832 [Poronia punctata]